MSTLFLKLGLYSFAKRKNITFITPRKTLTAGFPKLLLLCLTYHMFTVKSTYNTVMKILHFLYQVGTS